MSVTCMALKTVISPAIILFLFVLPTIAEDFSGEVVGVLDGDTLEVLHNNTLSVGEGMVKVTVKWLPSPSGFCWIALYHGIQ